MWVYIRVNAAAAGRQAELYLLFLALLSINSPWQIPQLELTTYNLWAKWYLSRVSI